MKCPACARENVAGARSCVYCAVPIAPGCSGCGSALPPGARFCPQCGIPAAPAIGQPASERRQITVLFCDIADSSAISTRLDPEEWQEVLSRYHSTVTQAVQRYDGYVAQHLGDGVLAYFGYPQAHEDDAQRAVRAAARIHHAIAELDLGILRAHGLGLAVRIGIHTGVVVVGHVGQHGAEAPLALGEVPVIAARLQEIAKPGQVLISEVSRRLVGGFFILRERGPQALKGIANLMPVFEVVGESPVANRIDAAGPTGLTPLVGRDAELAWLEARWAEARSGKGRVVLLRGEAGMGKSRLIRVMEQTVAADPEGWVTPVRASPYYQNSAFYPIIDLIERVILRFSPEQGALERRAALEGWLSGFDLPLTETMPLYCALLSLPDDPRFPQTIHDAERQKQKTMEIITRMLLLLTRTHAVLLVFEDLHWTDPSTLELLRAAVEQSREARVMLIVSYRPEFVPPWPRGPHVEELVLGRLSSGPAANIATWFAGGKALPQTVLDQIIARTDGNPLFVEELSKTVLESGILRESGGTLVLADNRPMQLSIPTTLHDSLMARLDRLAPVKMVAQIAAMLGREFSADLLLAVMPSEEDTLIGHLDRLVEAELLYREPGSPRTYVFKHALIQEAAYQATLRATRLDYHKRIADALTARFPDMVERQPELVAHHYTAAALGAEAIPYWQRAGQYALARAANLEAIAHFKRALELLATVPRSPEVEGQELALQMSLAPAYMAIKGWASPEVERTCLRAGELGAALGQHGARFGALWGLWTNYFLRGRLREALDTARDVIALVPQLPDGDGEQGPPRRMYEVMARHAMGYSHFYRGEFERSREHAEAGVQLFNLEMERGIVLAMQFSSTTALRVMLGESLWMLGLPDQAVAMVQSSVDLSRELRHHPSEAFALAASLLLHHYRLDVDCAAATSKSLFELAQKEGFEIWSPFALMFQGWAMVERDQPEAGLQQIKQGIAQWQATGSYLNQTIYMAMLARSLWRAGRVDEALTILEADMAAVADRAEWQFAPELYRLRGDILLSRGLDAEGEADLLRARDLARAQPAPMLELRATNSLARLWRRSGRADAAREALAPLYAAFREGHDTETDLRVARALLDVTAVH